MPTYGTSAKYALRKLLGGNVISDIDAGFDALATDLDTNMAGYAEGTFAGKPAAGKAGRIYRCTDTGQWLADTGSVWVDLNAAPGLVSSLPGSPFDGQEVYYSADPTNGVVWHLRYRSASASAYKWESIGANSPLTSEVLTNETTASSPYVDLATVGPSITVPLAGDYEFVLNVTGSSGASWAEASLKFGAAAVATPSAPDGVMFGGAIDQAPSRVLRRNVSAAATVVKIQYRSLSGTAQFRNRSLAARPIRVG